MSSLTLGVVSPAEMPVLLPMTPTRETVTAVPLIVNVNGLAGSSVVSVTVAVLVPTVLGANLMTIGAVLPAVMAPVASVVTVKSEALGPPTTTELIVSGELPVLVSVIYSTVLEVS